MAGYAKCFLFSILVLLVISSAKGATIYGTIYDMSINKVPNSIVEIDSSPRQRLVAVNSTYQFDVPIGNYKITAFNKNNNERQKAEENITVVDDGAYILDIFLYPDLSEDEQLYNGLDFDVNQPYPDTPEVKPPAMIWIILPVIGIMLFFLILLLKVNTGIMKKELDREIKEDDNDMEKVLRLLKGNGGRMTQKEIRKEFPVSEAKISLLIAEMESLGKIKKIKKGRGNIIILGKY